MAYEKGSTIFLGRLPFFRTLVATEPAPAAAAAVAFGKLDEPLWTVVRDFRSVGVASSFLPPCSSLLLSVAGIDFDRRID